MDVFEDKSKPYRKQLTKPGGNKVLRNRPHTTMFIVSFANLKSDRALSRDPLGDRVMPNAEVHIRAQASHGKITTFEYTRITPVKPVCDGRNDKVLGPAGEGRDDGSYKIDANLLSEKKKKVKFFYVNNICFLQEPRKMLKLK